MRRCSQNLEAVGWEQIQRVSGAALLEAEGTKWVEPTFLGVETRRRPVPPGASARNVRVVRRTWGIVRVGGEIKLVAVVTQMCWFVVQLLPL